MTNVNGEFLLLVNPDATLVVSFLGYESVEVPVSGKTDFKIVLQEDAVMLDDVIVTALGIEKKASSLSYSAMQLKSDELNRVKETTKVASGFTSKRNSPFTLVTVPSDSPFTLIVAPTKTSPLESYTVPLIFFFEEN